MYFELYFDEGLSCFAKCVLVLNRDIREGGGESDINFFCCRSALAADAVVGMVCTVITLVVFGLFLLDIVTVVLCDASRSLTGSTWGFRSIVSEVSGSETICSSSLSSSSSGLPSSQTASGKVLSPIHSHSVPSAAGICQNLLLLCCSTAVYFSTEQSTIYKSLDQHSNRF